MIEGDAVLETDDSETPPPDDASPRAISRAQRRQQARDAELQECGDRVQQLLAEYGCDFQVVAITRYPNGAAITTHQVNIIDGRAGR